MGFEKDFYEERRRIWRRSTFWRGFTVAAGLALVVYGIFVFLSGKDHPTGPHIARIFIDGVIYDDPEREHLLAEIAKDADVKAVIIRINSPGGTTVGAESLFDSLRKVAVNKPVVAVLGEAAASGGYVAAMAADHIIARGNTVTGSIGVILEYPDVTALMDKIGVEMQTIRSSGIKGGPSPYRPLTPEMRAEEQAMIEDANRWFRGLVSGRRNLTGAALETVATGGAFSGRQALANGLVDAIGGEAEALVYLESLDPSLAGYDVETWEISRDNTTLLGLISAKLGINPLFAGLSTDAGPRLYSLKR